MRLNLGGVMEETALAGRYLDLMKRSLMGVTCHLTAAGVPDSVTDGHFFVEHSALTMVGRPRLDNIEECVRSVLADDVPGDLMECGVWRGGACILMRAVLEALGDRGRRVHVADSFRGLPPPEHPADRAHAALPGVNVTRMPLLAVSQADVRRNFELYGLGERVVFHEGWFRDTLPGADTGPLAVLRLDGDFYESTMDALRALEPRVSPGGYVIIDDYGAVPAMCGQAVDDYRRERGIDAPLEKIDWTGVYWRKP